MRSLPSQKAATHPFRLLARASESVLPRLTIPSTMMSELNMAGMPVPRRSTSQQRRRNFGCATNCFFLIVSNSVNHFVFKPHIPFFRYNTMI